MAIPGLLIVYFRSFQPSLQILQQINVHPVYGAGIRTHDLWNMSLPQLTTRGLRPILCLSLVIFYECKVISYQYWVFSNVSSLVYAEEDFDTLVCSFQLQQRGRRRRISCSEIKVYRFKKGFRNLLQKKDF